MHFANPWGLLGLLSLPVIAVIHLYQRRLPPLSVAGAHLWGIETRAQTAGRRRDRLPLTATLLLELLAGLFFSMALAQPRLGRLTEVAHLVVVLDDSASMSAVPPGEPSAGFRQMAIDRIAARLKALGRGSRVTLIRSGPQPVLLGRQGMNSSEAQEALEDWWPRAPRHDFQPAWDEAARRVKSGGRFLFVTDHLPDEANVLPTAMELISVGQLVPNVAISTARWTFDSATHEGRLFARLSNFGDRTTTVRVQGLHQSGEVLAETLDLPARGERPLEARLPGGLGELVLKLSSSDNALVVDDQVTLIEPQIRLLTVAVTLPEDSLESQLVTRVLTALPDLQLGPVERAQLVVGPAGPVPSLESDQWWLGIGPLQRSAVLERQARDLLGPYLIEKQHPLMNGILLDGVVWGGVQPLDGPMQPLVSAGRTPLLGRLLNTSQVAYLMNIDLNRSNLANSPDWPILVTNLAELRRDELPGLRLWNYRAGETVRFRAPPPEGTAASTGDTGLRELQLRTPSGGQRPLICDRRDQVEIAQLSQAGVYEIRERDRSLGEFAVNFLDPAESSLAELGPGERAAMPGTSAARLQREDPYSWLMVLAILMLLGTLLADWWILRPLSR
jgi:hypothetical protein